MIESIIYSVLLSLAFVNGFERTEEKNTISLFKANDVNSLPIIPAVPEMALEGPAKDKAKADSDILSPYFLKSNAENGLDNDLNDKMFANKKIAKNNIKFGQKKSPKSSSKFNSKKLKKDSDKKSWKGKDRKISQSIKQKLSSLRNPKGNGLSKRRKYLKKYMTAKKGKALKNNNKSKVRKSKSEKTSESTKYQNNKRKDKEMKKKRKNWLNSITNQKNKKGAKVGQQKVKTDKKGKPNPTDKKEKPKLQSFVQTLEPYSPKNDKEQKNRMNRKLIRQPRSIESDEKDLESDIENLEKGYGRGRRCCKGCHCSNSGNGNNNNNNNNNQQQQQQQIVIPLLKNSETTDTTLTGESEDSIQNKAFAENEELEEEWEENEWGQIDNM